MTEPSRPAPRTRPKPAADEHRDPAVPAAAPQAKTIDQITTPGIRITGMTPSTGRQTNAQRPPPEPVVQLNTRVSVTTADIVDAVVTDRGWTKRAVIEHAIRSTYLASDR